MSKEAFDEILETFETTNIKIFAEKCIETIPPYFWVVPASSSLKYHGLIYCQEGGLARHTLALCRIMNHLFNLDWFKQKYSAEERDCLRLAGLMHDTRKSGSQEDYEKSKWTKFDHPIQAAKVVYKTYMENKDSLNIRGEYIDMICKAIESHMGQWSTDKRSSVVLPVPEADYQALLHICDYLASRKDIEIKFPELDVTVASDIETLKPNIQTRETPDVNTWTLPFGKYKGLTLPEVQLSDPGYIEWAKTNATSEPFRTLANEL